MRIKNPDRFVVLDDPFLDFSSIDLAISDQSLAGENAVFAGAADISASIWAFDHIHDARGQAVDLFGQQNTGTGASTVQGTDVMVVPPEVPPPGRPIQDADIVIPPQVEPIRPPVPVQGPVVFQSAPTATVFGPAHAQGAVPPIQDPDFVPVIPPDPNPVGGGPLQDSEIVVTPQVEPIRPSFPVQGPVVLQSAPTAAVFSPAHAQGAVPPIQDPDFVPVIPPPDPSPVGGGPLQDPDIVVTPQVEPISPPSRVQDPAFFQGLPTAPVELGDAPPWAVPSPASLALPVASSDWWLVS